MSDFFEKQFIKEFRELMLYFRSQTSLDIRALPVPFDKPTIVEKLYIQGITDEKYSNLNGQYVTRLRSKTMKRNIYKNNGEVKSQVNYSTKDSNLIVVTEDNLRLPFKYVANDSDLEYVDYKINEDRDRLFYYSVPKKYLYRTQQTALVLTQHSKRGHYGGIQLMLTNGYTVYLYVLPLKSVRQTDGNIAIKTKVGSNYSEELQKIQSLWLRQGIIFSREDLELVSVVRESSNLGYTFQPQTLDYEGVDEFSISELEEMRKTSPY